ncbi:ABC transporter substrate-binding protein [Providencia stuartii]|uniref:ABC transporter substrate-binding protein n=1 Tax=Providencia stuartii TaxID=588 RepID=UPI0012B58FD2|nr:ABC transporter substrate-binding protein [Providencia stuartii]MDT2042062.1 ABC transporter substrate-binding protein [Providencia stuartii]MTC10991.1 ABC transporter substrate-binding protein [Providencia stuartii]GHC00720.1 iron ABC transporter substrate-binding protein [Providencia thailandensis]HEM7145257.1 ABC transporter substrate-binding protein [Providencia stuartii]
MGINRRLFIQSCAALAALAYLPAYGRIEQALFGVLPQPNKIQRVMSSGPPADLLLFALAPEKMVGFSSIHLQKEHDELFAQQWRDLPIYGRLAGRGSTLSLEKLLDYNPQLIIDTGNIDDTYRSQAAKLAKQTGIAYLLIAGGLQDSAQQLLQLGETLNVPQQAQTLSTLAKHYLQDAKQFAIQHHANAPSFYLARGAKGLQTGTRGSIHTEAIEILGFRNVADIPNFRGLTEVSMEQLYDWNPDIIITQYQEAEEFIRQSALWKGLTAVATNQLLTFGGMPFGWLDGPPGINRLLGMRRLQSHFDQQIEPTIRDDIKQFFHLFYHSSVTDTQIDRLMELS